MGIEMIEQRAQHTIPAEEKDPKEMQPFSYWAETSSIQVP